MRTANRQPARCGTKFKGCGTKFKTGRHAPAPGAGDRFSAHGSFVGVLAAVTVGVVALTHHTPAWAQLAEGPPAASFTMEEWAFGLTNPTDMAFLPDGRTIVTQRNGLIAVVTPDGDVQTRAGRVENISAANGEQGLLGVVAHPNFADNQTVYFFASIEGDSNNKHQIIPATVSADNGFTLLPAILDQGLAGPANHNGGGMIIYKNQLYIGVGDTGANATPPRNQLGVCLNQANASILRINLDGSVPDDNPLVGLSAVTSCDNRTQGSFDLAPPDPRIYAWGFRNPWRFWIDPKTDLLWVGDVGEVTQEEISVGGKGANHGFPFFEGTRGYNQPWNIGCEGMTPSTACTVPVHTYGREDGKSVTGGLVPDSPCWPEPFRNRYIFGDYATNRLWSLDLTADRTNVEPNSRKDFGRVSGVASFRMGHGDALYAASYKDGAIVRISPKKCAPACAELKGSPDLRDAAPVTGNQGGNGGGQVGPPTGGVSDPAQPGDPSGGVPGGGAPGTTGGTPSPGTGGASPPGNDNAGGTGAQAEAGEQPGEEPGETASNPTKGGGCTAGGRPGGDPGFGGMLGGLFLVALVRLGTAYPGRRRKAAPVPVAERHHKDSQI